MKAAKIIRETSHADSTVYTLDNGLAILEIDGFQTGANPGIHNRFNTEIELRLMDGEEELDACGLDFVGTEDDSDVDWKATDRAIKQAMRDNGWIE